MNLNDMYPYIAYSKKGTKIGAHHPSPNTLNVFHGCKIPAQAAYQQPAGKMSRKLLLCVKSP